MKKAFLAAMIAAVWFSVGCAMALHDPDPSLSANDNAAMLQGGWINAGIGLVGLVISITWWIAKFREWRELPLRDLHLLGLIGPN